MDERLKQSISALMDDEVNELELQRILTQLDDDEVSDVWQRYHRVRDVMRGESFVQDAGPILNIDVSQSVSAWIDQDDSSDVVNRDQDLVEKHEPEYQFSKAGGFLALAASVVFAVVFVVQNNAGQSPSYPAFAQANESPIQFVSHDSVRQPKIVDQMNDQQARRLNQYLLRHAEHSMLGARQGAMPFVRVASVNSVGI